MQIAAEKEAIADVEAGAAVVRCGVELVGWEVGRAGGVGLGEVEHVEAEQRDTLRPDGVIDHELVLVVHTAGLELIDVLVDAVGANACSGCRVVGAGKEGIDVVGEILVNAARIHIGDDVVAILPNWCSTPMAACMLS